MSSSPEEPDIHEPLLVTIPRAFRTKAGLLYKLLQRDNNITWDERGTVYIKGQKLVGSNIIDLISDVSRSRKNSNPQGWKSFCDVLQASNIPRDLIGNPRRLKYVQGQYESSADGETDAESKDEQPSPKKRKLRRAPQWTAYKV